MRLLKLALVVSLACLALALVACGDDDKSDSGTTGGDTPATNTTLPADVQKDCLEQAEKIDNEQAREIAKQACTNPGQAAEDAQEQAREGAEVARKRCLEAAKRIPDDDSRKRAEQTCNALTGGE